MTAPSEESLAGARVYRQVRLPGVVPVAAEWFVLSDDTVWTRHEGGGWSKSMFDADTITGDGWEEVAG